MTFTKIYSNTAWLIVEKLVRVVSTLFVGAFVIRYLGPSEFGSIAYALATSSIFYGIATLGIEGILVRDLVALKSLKQQSQIEKKRADLLSAVFWARLLSGLGTLILALTLIYWQNGLNYKLLIIGLCIGSVLVTQCFECFDLYNQSELQSKKTAIAKIIAYILSNSMRLIFIHMEFEVIAFAVTYALEAIVTSLILYYYYAKDNYLNFGIRLISQAIKPVLRETWPIIIAAMCTSIAVRVDQIYVKSIFNEGALGIYSAAIVYASATFFLPAVICNSMLPVVTAAKDHSKSEYVRLLRWTYFINLICAFVVVAITSYTSDLIIAVMYGDKFEEAADVLRIYVWLCLPVYIGITHGLWIINDRKVIYLLYRAITGATLTIIIGYHLIPWYGAIGAAVSVLISQIISEILMPVIWNHKLFRRLIYIN